MAGNTKGLLLDAFMQYFSVEIADSESKQQEAYRIRYRVYCQEFKFESPTLFPDGLERDEYDSIARHCLIRHRKSGLAAGCIRLVPGSHTLLPVEKHCMSRLDLPAVAAYLDNRAMLCELSRLAVDTTFRLRDSEGISRVGDVLSLDFSAQETRSFSLVAAALILAGVALTARDNRQHIFAVMEPFLPRLMDKIGIRFQKVGKDMDYHGLRAPYFITTQQMLTGMLPEYHQLYQWVRNSIGD